MNEVEQRERTRAASRLRSLAMEMEYVGTNYMGHLSNAQAGRFHVASEIVRNLVIELTGETP